MFGLSIFSTKKNKNKTEINLENFLVIFGSTLHFLIWCSKFFSENSSKINLKSPGEMTQRQQDSKK